MANRTDKQANTVKGTNPQYLVEKIIRMRIYEARFWKEECFALSAELIVDKGIELRYIGGVYGGSIKPTAFICLILKMLQIQPEQEIIIEFIKQDQYKYIRALGAFYLRLTASSMETYKYLEPLYNDYRKLRIMNKDGKFELIHMDEFIDSLLRDTTVCSIQLPRLQKRHILEETNELEPRMSALEEDLDNLSSPSSDSETDTKTDRKSTRDITDDNRQTTKERPSRSGVGEKERGGGVATSDRRRSRSRERRPRDRRTPPPSSSSSRRKDEQKSGRDERKRTRETSEEREIRESNELRAKLGLAPLQR